MGKLNIAHHKSYHPYRAENIERVRRDEERAAALEAGDQARVMQADSEARIAMLRRKKGKKGKSREEDEAERALEKQLGGSTGAGRGMERASSDGTVSMHEEQQRQSRTTTLSTASDYSLESITTEQGHFNFWADLERGKGGGGGPSGQRQQQQQSTSRSLTKTNAEYEAEKKAEQDKWDSQVTMYIQAPPKSWYDSQDRLNHAERKQTADQKLERAYKDNEQKRVEDPMALMQAYLKRREDVKAAQERQQANPWMDTPRTLAGDRTPVQPSLLSKRGTRYHQNRDAGRRNHDASPDAGNEDIPLGPERPADLSIKTTTTTHDLKQAAATRELSERDRAKALIAAKRRESSSAASTPRSEFGYQTGMYNRDETRRAKGYSSIRWDEDRRHHRR